MNAKYRAKHYRPAAGALALVLCLAPLWVSGDDGNLNQQLRAQQNKSRFQLMLEQIQESARRRAALAPATTEPRASTPEAVGLGDWTESIRLDSVSVADPLRPDIDFDSASRLQASQAYERDQQRILQHRQRQRALIGAARAGSAIGVDGFAAKRGELVRNNSQNQRQSLQRKLRR